MHCLLRLQPQTKPLPHLLARLPEQEAKQPHQGGQLCEDVGIGCAIQSKVEFEDDEPEVEGRQNGGDADTNHGGLDHPLSLKVLLDTPG